MDREDFLSQASVWSATPSESLSVVARGAVIQRVSAREMTLPFQAGPERLNRLFWLIGSEVF